MEYVRGFFSSVYSFFERVFPSPKYMTEERLEMELFPGRHAYMTAKDRDDLVRKALSGKF